DDAVDTGRGLAIVLALAHRPHRGQVNDVRALAHHAQPQLHAFGRTIGSSADIFAADPGFVDLEELADLREDRVDRNTGVRQGKLDQLAVGNGGDGLTVGRGGGRKLLQPVPDAVGDDFRGQPLRHHGGRDGDRVYDDG